MNRRDLLLNAMGITQWELVKPQVLKGDAQIRLSPAIKFVVICEENRQTSGIFHDLLRTLQLRADEYQWLNREQLARITFDHKPIFWLIQPHEQAVKIKQKFANVPTIQTESWQDLAQSEQKRQLWRQIEPLCQHFEDE